MLLNPESSYSFTQPTQNAFIIEGLSASDRLSLIGPSGISNVTQKESRKTTYRIPGVVGLDVSSWVPEDKLVVYTQDERVIESAQKWLAEHFADMYAARRITEGALRKYSGGQIPRPQ